jgi:hypothetical protein
MLEPLSPGRVNLRPGQFIPPFLAALIAAAAEGRELLPFVSSVTAHLGFNSFMYAASAMPSRIMKRKPMSTRRCRSNGSGATTRWRTSRSTLASS